MLRVNFPNKNSLFLIQLWTTLLIDQTFYRRCISFLLLPQKNHHKFSSFLDMNLLFYGCIRQRGDDRSRTGIKSQHQQVPLSRAGNPPDCPSSSQGCRLPWLTCPFLCHQSQRGTTLWPCLILTSFPLTLFGPSQTLKQSAYCKVG